MGIALHPAHGHSHSGVQSPQHSHSHSSHLAVESETSLSQPAQIRKQNINVRAAFIHVIGDFIQSIGVLIAALIIYFKVNLRNFELIIFTMFSYTVNALSSLWQSG